MSKVLVDLGVDQIESALRQLNERERWRLTKQLVVEEMDDVVKKLRQNISRQKLSSKQINTIVEKARQGNYVRYKG